MRIFVAGATGAVGRRLVPRLINRGHSVTGLTRTPKTNLLRKFGADPVVADALDEKAIHAAVVAARPDVIVHQLTDLKGLQTCAISTAHSRAATGCAQPEPTILLQPRRPAA